ncbi:hypothetical protein [Mycolicibacterium fortuitum]
MKLWMAVAACTVLLTACGSTTHQESTASPAAPTTTIDPTDREYRDASELGKDLTDRGIDCDLEPTGGTEISTFGKCALPISGFPTGLPVSITVWNTPARATNGILAVTNHARVIAGINGKPHYYLTGANWLIDFDAEDSAARQVQAVFGGNLQKVS